MLGTLIQDVLLMFIVIDPLTLAVYLTATTSSQMSEEERNRLIRMAVLAATVILGLFAVIGDFIMNYFSISVNDFMVALGLVLLIFSILDFLGKTPYGSVSDSFAIVPVATPLIAGPAAISTIIYIKYAHGYLNAIASISVNMAITYIILKQGTKVSKLLGRTGSLILDKIISLILAALGVSLIRRGIEGIVATTYLRYK